MKLTKRFGSFVKEKTVSFLSNNLKKYVKEALADLVKAIVITAAIETIKERMITPAAQRLNNIAEEEGEDPIYEFDLHWWGSEEEKK